MRLDIFLKEKGIFESRKKASDAIKNGLVLVNEQKALKTSKEVGEKDEIKILDDLSLKYVSRAALKLLGAIEKWNLDFQDKVVLDLGASTGGFTEVVLERGAKKVFAVDVGRGQLHKKIKENQRVVNLEKTDARNLNQEIINQKFVFLVSDLSFISILKVFEKIVQEFGNDFEAVVLFKPQFEVGKENIGKNGIVKNEKIVQKKIEDAKEKFLNWGFQKIDIIKSPIKGGDGNQEYLFYLRK